MTNDSLSRRIFLWASPLPVVLHLLALWYVGRFDGWGAWAAAPMLLPAIILSGGMFLTGTAFWYQGRRSGRDPLLLIATLLAGSVALFYLIRALSRGMLI
ncbi:MAG: hypothetical protein HKM89_10155 [Gemmatimonadales bacterium]|nr:hypothetical protein [Gemmatimonadales bacterium]